MKTVSYATALSVLIVLLMASPVFAQEKISFHVGCDQPSPECTELPDSSGQKILVRKEPGLELGPGQVTSAILEHNEFGIEVLTIAVDEATAKAFGDLTAANLRKQLAIVVAGTVKSAPVVNEPITGGRFQLSLGESKDANELLSKIPWLAEKTRAEKAKEESSQSMKAGTYLAVGLGVLIASIALLLVNRKKRA